MNLNYSQSLTTWTDDDGKVLIPAGNSWSGNDVVDPKIKGKNNPQQQDVPNVGPLPRGAYTVGVWSGTGHPPGYPPNLGPDIASLTQVSGETYGRRNFFIQGDAQGPTHGQESRGNIVMPRDARMALKTIAPNTITVVL